MAQDFRARFLSVCEPCQSAIEPGQPVAYTLDEEVVHCEHHDDLEVRAAGAALGDARRPPSGSNPDRNPGAKRSADARSRAIAANRARRSPKARKAAKPATCPSCRSKIAVGDPIERWPAGGWAHAQCASTERDRLALMDGRTFARGPSKP